MVSRDLFDDQMRTERTPAVIYFFPLAAQEQYGGIVVRSRHVTRQGCQVCSANVGQTTNLRGVRTQGRARPLGHELQPLLDGYLVQGFQRDLQELGDVAGHFRLVRGLIIVIQSPQVRVQHGYQLNSLPKLIQSMRDLDGNQSSHGPACQEIGTLRPDASNLVHVIGCHVFDAIVRLLAWGQPLCL